MLSVQIRPCVIKQCRLNINEMDERWMIRVRYELMENWISTHRYSVMSDSSCVFRYFSREAIFSSALAMSSASFSSCVRVSARPFDMASLLVFSCSWCTRQSCTAHNARPAIDTRINIIFIMHNTSYSIWYAAHIYVLSYLTER